MIDAPRPWQPFGLRAIALTMLALSLGACRGWPEANSPHPPPYGSSRAGFPTPNPGAAVSSQPQHSPPIYNSNYHAPEMPPPPADDWPPAEQVALASAESSEIAPPSPALPRATADANDANDADFTPNVARVGHTASSLPPDLPPYAQVDGMHCCNDPFYPPHIWPLRKEEFLCDGGDQHLRVQVNHDWTVRGLDQEDTVVHYDTLAGGTNVEPSNCICIYAPRFAAVRKTVGPTQARLRQRSAGVDVDLGIAQQDEVDITSTVLQPLQPGRNIGIKQPIIYADADLPGEVGRLKIVAGLENGFLPYENLQIIRTGEYDQSEKARLAESIEAAIAWTHNLEAEAVIAGQVPLVQEGIVRPEELDTSEPVGTPRMRICKLASRRDALPGEIVQFTLRFDNTGTQPVGNVTIIDHLTTRLEYVPGSAECSLDANFITTEIEGESLVLRWEIIEPMQPGEGGIIRFQCRVR